jgi:hypothetical protein
MKKIFITAIIAMISAGPVSAAEWQSLGRIDASIQMPNVDKCQLRVINHYSSPKTVYYPTVIDATYLDQIQLIFDLQLSSLKMLTSNAPANSKFKTAFDSYTARTGAKSIQGSVWLGRYPSVSIDVLYDITPSGERGSYYHVVPSERKFYELQQLCPL